MEPIPVKNTQNKSPSFKDLLKAHADPKKAITHRSFFKNSQNDVFLGVAKAFVHKIAKEHWQIPLKEVLELMKSPIHEERSLAGEILCIKFHKADESQK